MITSFKGKKVLVTGYNSGIGNCLIKKYLSLGAIVFSTSTKSDFKQKNLTVFKSNFLDKNSKNNFFKKIEKISLDIVINNAGINIIDEIYNIKNQDIEDIIKINLLIPAQIIKITSKKMMKKRKGKIINISSIFGSISKNKRASYSSSKSGLIGLTKACALDLAKYNILVNSVSPGFVDTVLTRKVLGKNIMNKIKKDIPLKRIAEPGDIIPYIIFLTSDNNNYITGQNCIIDGGFTVQ
jgi:3-oxoacyl-[acyl-carrier protein] reductase